MTYVLRPSGALSELVEAIWLTPSEARARGAELIVPTGDADLIVELGADLSTAVVAGPSTRVRTLQARQPRPVLGVTFKVGGAAALLDVPLHELRDRLVVLSDLWPAEAHVLYERAATASSPAAAIAAAERTLAARMTWIRRWPHPVARPAAGRLAGEPQGGSVVALAESFGLSVRRFEQVFRADVGLAPKPYQRLHRFRNALVDIDAAVQVGWGRFAVEHGYYDQAHFVNEFRSHCGLTPTAYVQARGPEANHVPLADSVVSRPSKTPARAR